MPSDDKSPTPDPTAGGTDSSSRPLPSIDLSKPRYDQSTYNGRAKHFFETVNPLNVFIGNKRLEESAKLVKAYKSGQAPAGTTEEQLWEAKRIYDSAYHPETGEKMFIGGRMSFQVPGNMTIVGCMLTFYKTPAALIFWQWANQTFNSLANYTNRSGDEKITPSQVLVPYAAATGTATVTALTLNQVIAKYKRMPPLIGRLIPFVAIVAANSINIPLMRQREFKYGIPILDDHDNKLGSSKNAAKKGIVQVLLSRIFMAVPAMIVPPIVMNSLEKRNVLKRMPWMNAPMQILLVGFCLTFATPLCCAIFPQKSSISVEKLEPDVRDSLQRTAPHIRTVYFNKGL